MAAANPYERPRTGVADMQQDEYQPVKIFSVSGRIGRVRYIGYTFGLSILVAAVIGVLAALLGDSGLGIVVVVVGYLALLVIQIMLTVQRCHDFDMTGWLTLIIIIPLAFLVFWLAPGTKGSNRWGPETPPNGVGVVLLASIVPIIAIIGIVAAIALPAYQDYVERSRASQQQQPLQQP